MNRFGQLGPIRDYLTERGLADRIDSLYLLKVYVDGKYKAPIIASGDCNYDSVAGEVMKLGLIDKERVIADMLVSVTSPIDGAAVGAKWPSPARYLGRYNSGRAFVCELFGEDTYYINVITGERGAAGVTARLYGCPNAMLHDADGLRRRRAVTVKKYE